MHASAMLLLGEAGREREIQDEMTASQGGMREENRCPGIHNVVLQSTSTTRDNP
jgi:hypothetical protein